MSPLMHRLTTFVLAGALVSATFASPTTQYQGVVVAAKGAAPTALVDLLAAPHALQVETFAANCERSALDTNATPLAGWSPGLEMVLEMQSAPGQIMDPETFIGIRSILQRRLELLGVNGKVLRRSDGRILVRVDDAGDPDRVASAVASTMLVEIIDPDGVFLPTGTLVATTLGGHSASLPYDLATPRAGDHPVYETIVSGTDFTDVYVTESTATEAEVIAFELSDEASSRLYDYTNSHIGQPMAIVLDKRVISSPYVNAAISSSGIIEGVPPEEIPILVAQMRVGAVAVPLALVECHSVSVAGTDLLAT